MKVLTIHNRYQHRGGEDVVFANEAALLAAHGHDVVPFEKDNDAIDAMNPLTLAIGTVWNARAYREVASALEEVRPDVVHVHNTFPLLSPSIYYACGDAGVPCVQTLHNYRLLCPAATFLRDGRPCEDCLGKAFAWPGIVHACYRSSRAATTVAAATQAFHRARGTYRRRVDRYIALTAFAKSKFVAGGLPADRIDVRPNYVLDDPGVGDGIGGYALYVGRLSREKGLPTLLEAWRSLGARIPLRVVGDGPMRAELERAARGMEGVTILGHVPHAEVPSLMKAASMLVFPSLCYEGFPMTLAEAYAVGTPVVGSRLGATAELVDDGVTGALFTPGDARDLADKVARLHDSPEHALRLRDHARAAFEQRYSAAVAYETLMDVYRAARSAAPPHGHGGRAAGATPDRP